MKIKNVIKDIEGRLDIARKDYDKAITCGDNHGKTWHHGYISALENLLTMYNSRRLD